MLKYILFAKKQALELWLKSPLATPSPILLVFLESWSFLCVWDMTQLFWSVQPLQPGARAGDEVDGGGESVFPLFLDTQKFKRETFKMAEE